mgnify:CR=1 FL=1
MSNVANGPSAERTEEQMAEDYRKYRGKCKKMAEAACAGDPTLRLVRGHYYCPVYGEQPHWWCVRPDGSIHDPTALQFPSGGSGVYVEFDGNCTCSHCGKEFKEEEGYPYGSYIYCSNQCIMADVL